MKTHTTICPNCNSINTYPDVSKDMIAWGGITNTKCGDCDYSSTFFPEVPIKNLPQIKLKKKKKKEVKEIMSTKGIHKGKIWGWLVLIIAVITLLMSWTEGFLFAWVFPMATLQIILGILMIKKSKKQS